MLTDLRKTPRTIDELETLDALDAVQEGSVHPTQPVDLHSKSDKVLVDLNEVRVLVTLGDEAYLFLDVGQGTAALRGSFWQLHEDSSSVGGPQLESAGPLAADRRGPHRRPRLKLFGAWGRRWRGGRAHV